MGDKLLFQLYEANRQGRSGLSNLGALFFWQVIDWNYRDVRFFLECRWVTDSVKILPLKVHKSLPAQMRYLALLEHLMQILQNLTSKVCFFTLLRILKNEIFRCIPSISRFVDKLLVFYFVSLYSKLQLPLQIPDHFKL